jgi:amino acid adenylation domain-containing protein
MEVQDAGLGEVQGFELSAQQKRLWVLPAGRTARAAFLLGIEGDLDRPLLKSAVEGVVGRHEILRTEFRSLPGIRFPLQVVREEGRAAWAEIEGAEWPCASGGATVRSLARARAEADGGATGEFTPRLTLASSSRQRHLLLVELMSLCADFGTINNLSREIAEEYEALCEGTPRARHEPVQYADYAGWQGSLLEEESGRAAEASAFWEARPRFSYPTQLLRTCDPASVDEDAPVVVEEAGWAPEVRALCQRYGTTARAFYLASWLVLLWRLTGEPHAVAGAEFDGRTSPELEAASGPFARWLPISLTLDARAPFAEVLREVSEEERRAARCQDYYGLEASAGGGGRQGSEKRFTVGFEFHELAPLPAGRRVSFSCLDYEVGSEPFEVKLSYTSDGRGVAWKLYLDPGNYGAEDRRRLTDCLRELTRSAVADPSRPIGELDVLDAATRQRCRVEWNQTARDFSPPRCLQEMFESVAALHPERVALVFEGRRWRAAELNRSANRLAHQLRRLGAGPEKLVGLFLEHSDQLVVAALGVLKSGAAFVPLNPDLPDDRLRLLVRSTTPPLVISTRELAPRLEGADTRFVLIDAEGGGAERECSENPQPLASADNLAYVIYTSGSTGGPKGVMVEHRSVFNLANALRESVYAGADDLERVSLNGSLSFDTSIKQLVQLCFGRTLCVVPPRLKVDGAEMLAHLAADEIDVLDCTPSQLRLLIDAGLLDGAARHPRVVLLGGEAIDAQTWQALSSHHGRRFYNVYGPTECTVDATVCELAPGSQPALGGPLANVRVYILDGRGNLTPPGVVGELYIGGAGVGRGYFHRPGQTAERFVPDPFGAEAGARIYRTGDFGRHLAAGRIEYRGRQDDQVKIRGSRVEPAEVEEVLGAYPAVERAVVLPQVTPAGEALLVAYVVCSRSQRLTTDALREQVRSRLPEYMMPARFARVEAIPLTRNGKVDRRLLVTMPDLGFEEEAAGYEAPRTPTEELVAEVWGEVLQRGPASRDANFFDLGGYSLLALKIIARLRQRTGVTLPVGLLFNKPTIADLASELDRVRAATQPPADATGRGGSKGAPPQLSQGQQRLWFLSQLMPGDTSYNILLAVRLRGELRVRHLEDSLSEIRRRHETLRCTFAEEDGLLRAVFSDEHDIVLPFVDLSALDAEEARREARSLALAESRVPFDLSRGPLLRLHLLKLVTGDHLLLLLTHHVVFDGSSVQLFLGELAALYEAAVTGRPHGLPRLPMRYSDYAGWQAAQLAKVEAGEALEYWREQLKGAPSRLPLPYDYPAGGGAREGRNTAPHQLPADLARRLRERCRREGVTPFAAFLAAYAACIVRWTGARDLVVTSPSSLRALAEAEPLIGFFVNNLVLRVRLPGVPTYGALLGVVREVVLGALASQDVPFESLLEVAGADRRSGQTPFDQFRFDLQSQTAQTLRAADLTLTLEESRQFEVRYDLFLVVREADDAFSVSLGYDARRFRPETADRLLGEFLEDLRRLTDEPESTLGPPSPARREGAVQEVGEPPAARPKLERLLGTTPKPVRLSGAELVAESFLDPQRRTPLVITPRLPGVKLAQWAEASRGSIEERLLRHGGLLFRGFGLKELGEFEEFVATFGLPLLEYREPSTPRTLVRGHIYTSTEYNAELGIALHSENSYTHTWPMRIWFFCQRPADTGGRTLVADNREVYRRIAPGLRERMARESVMYVRNYHPRLDLPWQEVFQTTERSEVERYCRENSITCEWPGEAHLRTTQVCQAVATHPQTGEPVWFNQAHLFHLTNLPPSVRETLQASFAERDLPRNTFYGDGSPIEAEALQNILEAYRLASVAVDWREGDILMLDNMLASHGREPFDGTRKVVVAMAEPRSSNQLR